MAKKILVSLATNPAIEITGMKSLFALQKKLAGRGYEIHLITPDINPTIRSQEHYYRNEVSKNKEAWFKEQEKESGIKFHLFRIGVFKNLPLIGLFLMRICFLLKVCKLLIKEKFDIVHEYFSLPALALETAFYRVFFKKNIFCTLCSNVDNKVTVGLLKIPLKNKWVNRFFFLDQYSFNQFAETTFADKTVWLPLGCDYDALYGLEGLSEEIEKIKKELKVMSNDRIILFLGPLVERKGPFELTEAFKDIARLHKDTLLIFATPPVNQEAVFHYQNKKKIMDLGGEFNNQIRFLEGVYNIAALMRLADIIAVPLKTIAGTLSYPLTLLEALRSGAAIITSNINGSREIIQDGFNGMLYNNRKEFSDKLSILLNSPDLRMGLGEKAKESSQKYEFKNFINRLSQFYDEK